MENRVGTAGGTVEFEYKVESTEAGKWYQGNHRVVNPVFVLFPHQLFLHNRGNTADGLTSQLA